MSGAAKTLPLVAREQPNYAWYGTTQAAEFYGRHTRTICRWCSDGTLVEAGCTLYRDPAGQWWIGIPRNTSDTSDSTHL